MARRVKGPRDWHNKLARAFLDKGSAPDRKAALELAISLFAVALRPRRVTRVSAGASCPIYAAASTAAGALARSPQLGARLLRRRKAMAGEAS